MLNGQATEAIKENTSGTPHRFRRFNIGPRLTLCFLMTVFLMVTADFIAWWQFKSIEVSAHRFYQVDQKSLAVMRAHLGLMELHEALATLANQQDQRRFAVEVVSQRDHVVRAVQHAEETLKSFPHLDENVAITLETVGTLLSQQADALLELANAGDWQGVRLRLTNHVRSLLRLTSQLVNDVDQEATQERDQALASTQRARDRLALVLSITAAFTLLMAIVLGWYATRSITGPLAALDQGAKALASGDFQHQIELQGQDELARLGTAFNYATRQVRELYDELKRNEARFRALIEHSSDLVMIVDCQGKIRYVSPASVRVAGRTQSELLGHDLTDFLPSEDVPKVRAALRSAPERARAPVEIGFRRADGNLAAIELLANDLFGEPAVAGVVVNARDITERKHAEEALRQTQAELAHLNRVSTMGELGTSLAHELNQPIAAAMTNAKTCFRWLERNPPELGEAREAITRIVSDLARAAGIINHLRSLYKKGAPTERDLVDVNEIAHEMLALLRSEASRYSISIRAELAAELPKIKADRVQLQQVFMNLMLNAIEAMKDTGGELTIESERGGNGQLLISIKDAGVGLPTENVDQVFSAFFTTKSQGTGMGLSISRTIVESHGGRIWAQANTGRGATFQFTLPNEAASTPAPDALGQPRLPKDN
jgi:PAS domain S-box-containing protein